MKLEGKAREQLCLALLSAFPTRASLTQMVAFGLNQNLPTIAEGTNLAEAVGQLVAWAEEQGHLAAVVSSASDANPTNPELQAVVNLCDWVKLDAWDPWAEPVACPYPGMRPFHANEMPYFYGRQVEVDTLLQRLRVQRLVMIIGPSGSGKSSLVAAGLLPQLATSSYWPAQHWLVRRMRPGATPIARLSEALAGEALTPAASLGALLAAHPASEQVLLVVDQMEELFTQAPLAEQQKFITLLQTLSLDLRCILLLVMRADFYPEIMNTALWPIDFSQRMEIAPLRGEALRQAIVQPATDVGVTLEADLVERLLADAADEPGTLPLLQETLVLLWNKMQRRRLTLAAYEQLGHAGRSGLMVALATRADAALAALPSVQQTLAQRILLRLVQFGEGRPDTRRQQPVSALQAAHDDPALFDQTLQALATARLVTLSGSDAQETQVDLAHEALIRGWPQFQQWVQAQRVAELTRRRLVSQAAEWRRLGAGEGGLLDRRELPEAESWLASAAPIGVDADVLALIDHSRLAIRQSIVEQTTIWQRDVADAAIKHLDHDLQLSLLLAREAVGTAWRSYQPVDPQTRDALYLVLLRATARRVFQACKEASWSPNGRSILTITGRQETKIWDVAEGRLLLTLRANQSSWSPDGTTLVAVNIGGEAAVQDSHTGNTRVALRGKLPAWSPDGCEIVTANGNNGLIIWEASSGHTRAVLSGAALAITAITWSPNGQYLVAAETSGILCIWKTIGGPVYATLDAHTSRVWALAWSPDGCRLATAGEDWTVRIWDIADARAYAVLLGHVAPVSSVHWSPDGRLLVSASKDGTARIWDALSGSERATLIGHTAGVKHVRWSPDGQCVATASADTTIKIWDAMSAHEIATLRGHAAQVSEVAWHADGQWLLSSGEDNTARIWDVPKPAVNKVDSEPSEERDHSDFVSHINWSPDGLALAVPTPDCALTIWDVASGQVRLQLKHHRRRVNGATWDLTGKHLVTASEDRTAIIWDTVKVQEQIILQGHTDAVRTAVWSPEGSYILTASADQTARIWNAATGEEQAVLTGHEAALTCAAWNPQGDLIMTASVDGTVRLWTGRQPCKEISVLDGHGPVLSAGWSSDGRILAFAGMNGAVTLWDIVQRREGITLRAHRRRVNTTSYRPDGRALLTASDDGIGKIWNIATSQGTAIMDHHKSWVTGGAWHPDGSVVATLSFDGTVKIWDATNGTVQMTLDVAADWVTDTSWLFTERQTTAATDTSLKRPDSIGVFDLLAVAQTRITRTLSEDELVLNVKSSVEGVI